MKRVVLSPELLLLVHKRVKSMTKREARDLTVYYEGLLYGQKTDPPKPYSNIVDSFIQEDINSMEEDDYPGL